MHSTILLTTALLALTASSFGQGYPPAQGPPAPPPNTGVRWLSYYFITEQVKAKVETKLFEINADLYAKRDIDNVQATVTPVSVKSYGTMMTQTQYPDRPNSRHVTMPHIITIKVSNIQQKKAGVWIPYPWDRYVTVSTNVMVFCKGWETGDGNITIQSQSDPPYLDPDPSFSEAFVNFFLHNTLTDKVNSKLRAALKEAGIGATSSGTGFGCNCLGVDQGTAGNIMDDYILWAKVPTFISRITPQITVRPVKIKRLAARTFEGAVLYDPMESPFLEMYAGFGHSVLQLPSMVEGQEIFLSNMPPITVRRPDDSSSLIVISSLTYPNKAELDSNFQIFPAANNFGTGTQTLVIKKTYWRLASPATGTKPTKWMVPGYEITFKVEQSGVFSPVGGALLQ